MAQESVDTLSRWTLRLDAAFLMTAGTGGIVADTPGHFFGVGLMGETLGSPYTIGGFEAHGLAVILGASLFSAANRTDRRLWHSIGLTVHPVRLGQSAVLVDFRPIGRPGGRYCHHSYAQNLRWSSSCLSVSRPKRGIACARFGGPARSVSR